MSTKSPSAKLIPSAALVSAERAKQIAKGYTVEADLERRQPGSFLKAAACYLAVAAAQYEHQPAERWTVHRFRTGVDDAPWWPWDNGEYRPEATPELNAVKAAALICAELELAPLYAERERRRRAPGHS